MSDDHLYKVAYDEAVRALSEQQAAMHDFRSRMGLLLSVTTVTTSFLGTQVLREAELSIFAWLALLGFLGVAMVFLAILWPRCWEFSVDPQEVIETYIEADEPAPIEELHRELSIHMNGSYLENQDKLEKLVVLFQIANVLFVIEVVFWIAAVALAS